MRDGRSRGDSPCSMTEAMANPEHLAILKQGVKVWNEWRQTNPTVIPDLAGVDLTEGNRILKGANLGCANLEHAKFTWARLIATDLSEACLVEADFRWADLRVVKL